MDVYVAKLVSGDDDRCEWFLGVYRTLEAGIADINARTDTTVRITATGETFDRPLVWDRDVVDGATAYAAVHGKPGWHYAISAQELKDAPTPDAPPTYDDDL